MISTSYPISRTSLRLGASTSMALLRLRTPSGMNGGLSCTQEETCEFSPFTSRHTGGLLLREADLPSGPSWQAWPGGAGSGRRAPSCPSSWSRRGSPGAGRRPGESSAITKQTRGWGGQTDRAADSTPYLVFHLSDSLLSQRACLDHTDPLGCQLLEDLLWVGGDRTSSQCEKLIEIFVELYVFWRGEESPDSPQTAR